MDVDRILKVLRTGTVTVKGEFLWGSNYTFLVQVADGEQNLSAVYKPTRGERPLWDFPASSLARREVAAFLVSQALGWSLVPPTVYRRKAPLGPGSLQYYIEHDPEYHYFNFVPEDRSRLRPVALFDYLINNADRKAGHVLRDIDGHLWLIDHGLCFHVEEKLRTVIWDFVDEDFPDALCADLALLSRKLAPVEGSPSGLAASLQAYLSPAEVNALASRAAKLVEMGRFPSPDPDRRPFPWPQI